jgi:GT2 family glycosyltransferase
MDYLPGIDVIVVNYKTPRDLADFGNSFIKSHHEKEFPFSLWLCNVQPELQDLDAAHRILERADEGYDLTFEDNVGYSGAVNHAASLGKREVIAIFNADVVLSPRTLHDCAKALLERDDWGILGPKQTDGKGRLTHAGIFGSLQAPKMRGWQELDRGQYNDIRDDGVSVSGSAYFIKRTVWDELLACPLYRREVLRTSSEMPIGSFLNTPHYYRSEETFCSYHAISHGWKVVFYGDKISAMVHKWHQASPVGGFADNHFKESQKMFRSACDAHDIPRD